MATILVEILGDAKQFKAELEGVSAETEKTGSGFAKMAKLAVVAGAARAAGTGPFGYRKDRELSPHEQFFMVLLSPRTPVELKRRLRGWETRVLDGEITPQETQDLRAMYQNFVT